jgi:hypothetical protein
MPKVGTKILLMIWDRLAVGEGQHVLIGINQQERLEHHAVDHRLMYTERE